MDTSLTESLISKNNTLLSEVPFVFDLGHLADKNLVLRVELDCGHNSQRNGALMFFECDGCGASDFGEPRLKVSPTVGPFLYLETQPGRQVTVVSIYIPNSCKRLRVGLRSWYCADKIGLLDFSANEDCEPILSVERLCSTVAMQEMNTRVYYAVEARDVHGSRVPLKVCFEKRMQPGLSVVFHGAVNQELRSAPDFPSELFGKFGISTLFVVDPALAYSKSVTSGWFLGTETFEAVSVLIVLISQVRRVFAEGHLFFVGGSSGGFAAILYSWHFANSVVIAANPQINLRLYEPFTRNMRVLFPARYATSGNAFLDSFENIDLGPRYAKKFTNHVIYIQNSTDYSHMRHFSHFLNACTGANGSHLLADVGYWGKRGHAPIATRHLQQWIAAVLSAPSLSSPDIWDALYTMASQGIEETAVKAKDVGFRELIEEADSLAKWHRTRCLG